MESSGRARDVLAGLTLAAYLVPAGIGDASLAGLPPEAGLYACLFSGLVFWIFCSSRRTVVTVTSALSLLAGASVGQLSGGDPARHAALAAAMAMMVGGIAIAAWLLNAGNAVAFFSETVLVGFKVGLAFYLASTQLPKLLGFAAARGDFWERSADIVRHLGDTHMPSLLVGGAALAVLVAGKLWAKNRPIALLVVIGAIVAARVFDLQAQGVRLLGAVPQGLPMPAIPAVSRADLNALFPAAIAAFLLAAVETSAIGRMFAQKHGERFDANRELLAIGVANIAAGAGRGLAVSGGMSQSVVNESAGARSPFSGLVSALVTLVVVLFASGLLRNLPQPVLAAIVLAAILNLVDVAALRRIWRFSRSEFAIAAVAIAGVLGSGPEHGVLLGAGLSIVLLVKQAARPTVTELGRIGETSSFGDRIRHPEFTRTPGVLIVRCEASVVYFNVEYVRQRILELLQARDDDVRLVVFSLGASPRIDLAGAEMLEDLHKKLEARGIVFRLADAHGDVRDALRRIGFEHVHGTLESGQTVDVILKGWRAGESAPGGHAKPAIVTGLLLALLLWPAGGAAAAQVPAPTGQTPTVDREADADANRPAPVQFGGETILWVTAGAGAYTPEFRAERIARRLDDVIHDRTFRDIKVTVTEVEGASELHAGRHLLMTVTAGDAAGVGVGRASLAEQYARIFEETIRNERLRYMPATLIRSGAYGVAATLVLATVVWLIVRLTAALRRGLTRRLALRSDTLREVLKGAPLGRTIRRLTLAVRVLAILFAFDLYLTYVLGLFPWTRAISHRLLSYVFAPMRALGLAVVGYIPKFLFLVVITAIITIAIRLVRAFFRQIADGRVVFASFPPEWAAPTDKIVRVLLIAFGLVVAFPFLPASDSPAFTGVSVFMGVLVSLASSSALSNAIAGIVLTYTSAFRLGDRVKIGDAFGDIIETSLLATRIRTIKNEEITIPNSIALGSAVTNYTREAQTRGLILHTSVTIGYDAPWRKVHGLLIEAAAATRGILADPKPFVWQTALNDFYVTYEINAYTASPVDMIDIYAALHAAIQDAFYAAGVEIMSPHYASLRDGNTVAIPEPFRAPDYRAKAFRVEQAPDSSSSRHPA